MVNHPKKLWKCNQEEFSEGQAWPGQAFSLQVEEVLYEGKSKFQDVLVFKSRSYGNVLVLDGVIQATERDEFSYQEMMAHLPMFSHPNPKNVLIIGGGDGGVLREVLKHSSVETVTLCEIDKDVIDVSKKYLPNMAAAYSDPKVSLHIGDGHAFLESRKNAFDVVITDSSDPLGPAESLFGKAYYERVKEALTDNGVLSSQGESMWLHLHFVAEMTEFCRSLFPQVEYANICVPTYPSGVIGCLVCSKSKNAKVNIPQRTLSEEDVESMGLRYYNSEIHSAAFVVPQFVKNAIKQKK